jgi:undecaprenyl-diphosphatase
MKKGIVLVTILFLIISVVFTILVKTVDVQAIGPEDSSVGFASFNGPIHDELPFNDGLYMLSKLSGLVPFGCVAGFAIFGIYQLVTRGGFGKVDKRLYALMFFYILMLVVYIFFEKVIINYRPIIKDVEEGLEASYPSSHTLLAVCICMSTIILVREFMEDALLRRFTITCSFLLMVFIVVTRILSGVHWATDIIGGLFISAFLLSFLKSMICAINAGREKRERAKAKGKRER